MATSSSGASEGAISVFAPNENPDAQRKPLSIFLAGSIEMGEAPDWQLGMIKALGHHNIAIYNPRRGADFNWDKKDDSLFREQVDWEHKHLDESDIICMYICESKKSEGDGKTPELIRAPITLLELGLFAKSGKIIMGCAEDFWRLGNVKWVCKNYGITLVHTQAELVMELEKKITELERPASQKRTSAAAHSAEAKIRALEDEIADLKKKLAEAQN